MPSGRTSTPELPANGLLATLPACSGRRLGQPCRRHDECKLGDQTKDDADKEPRDERSCGRSQTSLYNEVRPHSSLGYLTPNEFVARQANAAPRHATGQGRCGVWASAPWPVAQTAPRGAQPASKGSRLKLAVVRRIEAGQPPGPVERITVCLAISASWPGPRTPS
jgi:hypothetical protein